MLFEKVYQKVFYDFTLGCSSFGHIYSLSSKKVASNGRFTATNYISYRPFICNYFAFCNDFYVTIRSFFFILRICFFCNHTILTNESRFITIFVTTGMIFKSRFTFIFSSLHKCITFRSTIHFTKFAIFIISIYINLLTNIRIYCMKIYRFKVLSIERQICFLLQNNLASCFIQIETFKLMLHILSFQFEIRFTFIVFNNNYFFFSLWPLAWFFMHIAHFFLFISK